jgi:hypothetical protein
MPYSNLNLDGMNTLFGNDWMNQFNTAASSTTGAGAAGGAGGAGNFLGKLGGAAGWVSAITDVVSTIGQIKANEEANKRAKEQYKLMKDEYETNKKARNRLQGDLDGLMEY